MSLAISSAIPNDLSRYSSVGSLLNAELASESNHLASVLQHFEAMCRESGYTLRVSHLADELRSYARQTELLDRWVGVVGVGFFVADSARDIVTWAERVVGGVLVVSVARSGRYLRISLDWVRAFGLTPSGVRTFFGITATRIRVENLLKHWDKAIGKVAVILLIALRWAEDFRDYTGTELISALLVDAVLAIIVVKIASVVGGLVLAALVKVALPAIVVGALVVGAVIVVASILDWVFEDLGIRDWAIIAVDTIINWTINAVDTAVNWTKDRVSELPELRVMAVAALDEKIFMPVSRAIATGVDSLTDFVDTAAQRLQNKLRDTVDAAGQVLHDRAIRPTSGEALELRNSLHDAMDGWGAKKDAIMRLIADASDVDKAAILNDVALLERLQRELDAQELLQVAKELADVSNLPAGSIHDTIALLAISPKTIDQATARLFLEGRLKAYYIEDLRQPDDTDRLLEEAGYDPRQYTLYLRPPDNTELMLVQKNFKGTVVGDSIFVSRAQSPDWLNLLKRITTQQSTGLKTIFVHEANHAISHIDISTPVGYFESEFLAYWVAGFESIADPDKRAQRIRAHILATYPHVKEAYDTDPDVKRAIDAYTRPKGPLTNEL